MNVLLVAGFGALGAVARYGVGVGCTKWFGDEFPVGTLVVNVLGAFLLGYLSVVLVDRVPPAWKTGLTTGMLGAFTTFSTFSVESLKLAERGEYGLAALNVLANVAAGLLAAGAGLWLGQR